MMKKLISGLVLLAMLACLVLPAAAAEPTALPMTVAEAVDGVSAYCTAAMQAAGTYSDWSILQLARSGNLTDAMRQDYLASLAEKLRACGGVLDKSYYTQYSRTILALTACGENARDFAGYDLTAPLANYDQTVWQGVNGAAFALIAMDSVSYGFAASGSNSRARLVAYLLAQELPGGGWDYSGKTADPDQTAMVLQALAPYRTQANVSAAIDRALNVLSLGIDLAGPCGAVCPRHRPGKGQPLCPCERCVARQRADELPRADGNRPCLRPHEPHGKLYGHGAGGLRPRGL